MLFPFTILDIIRQNTSRLDKFCQINDTTFRSIDGFKDICIQADVENLSQGAVTLGTSKALNIV